MKSLQLFRIIFSLPLLIIGIVMLVLAGVQISHRNAWVRTTAVITSITEKREPDGDLIHTVTVTYQTEDGDEYTDLLGYYQSDYREGMTVDVCYDPEQPDKVMTGGNGIIYLFGGLGAVSLFSALFVWFLVGFVGKKLLNAYDQAAMRY